MLGISVGEWSEYLFNDFKKRHLWYAVELGHGKYKIGLSGMK